jgi:23S rRNA U2552 (ribose-2'-O)-methylase RlmE/FtsJ
MKQNLKDFATVLQIMVKQPRVFLRAFMSIPSTCESYSFSKQFKDSDYQDLLQDEMNNPLLDYFRNYKSGPGLWKWEHYFEVYHRHLSKFVGKKVDVLEIGIYSGGSLQMWRSYFGDQAHIFGVDIEEACKAYESENVSVYIGDQEDRNFWQNFKNKVGGIDILIDDGGHTTEQQRITLEEMLGQIRPGGVYICEDVHGNFNKFSTYAASLVNELNNINRPDNLLDSKVTSFQSAVHSIHFYPYMVVIEKNLVAPKKLSAPKHGTEWQPFLKGSF